MAEKKFNNRFIHPTRRKLVDMVHTGEYEKDTKVSLSDIDANIVKRNIGDVWEDDAGNIWEQKSWGRIKKTKLSDTISHLRNYIQASSECFSSECDKTKYTNADRKLIQKTGVCCNCLAKREQQIRIDGLWEQYEGFKIYSNMADHATDVLQNLNHALDDVKNIHEFINDDGSVEVWKQNKDVEDLKSEIQRDIDSVKLELEKIIQHRNECYEKLKDKNYELLKIMLYEKQ